MVEGVTDVFVDTSAWYAFIERNDRDHAVVLAQIRAHRGRLTTSNFVLDETVTLLRSRLGWHAAQSFGSAARAGRLTRQARVTVDDEDAAWDIFLRYRDHEFSFTDCTSFALAKRLNLPAVITLDQDFRTFGLHCLP